jgi:hypothetical protein
MARLRAIFLSLNQIGFDSLLTPEASGSPLTILSLRLHLLRREKTGCLQIKSLPKI